MKLIKEEVVDSNGLKRSKAMVLRRNLTLRRFHGDLVFYKSPNEFSSLLSPFFIRANVRARFYIQLLEIAREEISAMRSKQLGCLQATREIAFSTEKMPADG